MPTLEVVADIFDGYQLAQAWDEMFAAPGDKCSSDQFVTMGLRVYRRESVKKPKKKKKKNKRPAAFLRQS